MTAGSPTSPAALPSGKPSSAERAHAASVAAASGALRRVKDREQTRRPETDERRGRPVPGRARRAGALEAAEAEAHEAQARLGELKSRLQDPALYSRPDAAAAAAELSRAVNAAVTALESALERWARATGAVEEAERAAAGMA